MSDLPSDHDTLLEQVHALAERRLDADAAAALKRRLAADEDARRLYVHALDLCAQLRWRYAEQQASQNAGLESPNPARALPIKPDLSHPGAPRAKVRVLRPVYALAATLLLAACGVAVYLASLDSTPQPPDPPPASVGVLVESTGVIWNSEPRRVGDDLTADRLTIDAGALTADLRSGVSVELTGPASVFLPSTDRAELTRGLLSAYVPERAIGFTVGLPDGSSIVDLGTAFTVNATDAGRFAVFVDTGRIAVHHASAAPLTATAGRLVGIDTTGRTAVADSLVTLVDTPWADADAVGPIAGRLIARDPAVVAYRTFDDDHAAGRSTTSHARRFATLEDRTPVKLDRPLDRLTLAAWVKLDPSPDPLRVLMITDEWGPLGRFSWDIRDGDSLCLAVSGNGSPHYHAPHVLDAAAVGRWMHLAVVYDSTRKVVEHYVDGRRVSSEPITKPVTLAPGAAGIGGWEAGRERPLIGSIDELIVADTALAESQVHALWRIGQPKDETTDEGDTK